MPIPAVSVTPSETRVLQTLERRSQDALPPTLRELAAALGWRSVASVREYLQRLQAKGLVRVVAGRARAIRRVEGDGHGDAGEHHKHKAGRGEIAQ
jgi:SOS-response transcriptional repressor LexA